MNLRNKQTKYYLHGAEIELATLAKMAKVPLTTMWSRLNILKKTVEESIAFKLFRDTVFTLGDGETATISEFTKRYNVSIKNINHRHYQQNWTIENAIKNPHARFKLYIIDGVEHPLNIWCNIYNTRIVSVLASLNRGIELKEALMSRKLVDKKGNIITQQEFTETLYEKVEEYVCTENISLTSEFRRKNKKLYQQTSESGLIPILVKRGFLSYG